MYPVRPMTCRLLRSVGDPSTCDGHASKAPEILPIQKPLVEYREKEQALLGSFGVHKLQTLPISTALFVAEKIHEQQSFERLQAIVLRVYAQHMKQS